MRRVPLNEVIMQSSKSSFAASFAADSPVRIYLRGTEIAATVYADEEGPETLSQALRTDDDGRVKAGGELLGWLEPLPYEIEVGGIKVPYEPASALPFPFYSPLSFGARGDGDGEGSGTDDAAAMRRMIEAAEESEGAATLAIPPRIYRLSEDVVVKSSNVRVHAPGAIFDCSGRPAATDADEVHGLRVEGTIGTPVAVTEDIAAGDLTVKVSTAGLSTGDIIRLTSEEDYVDGVSTETAGNRGLLHKIASIDDDSTLSLTEPSLYSYSASAAATVTKIDMLEGIVIDGLRVKLGGEDSLHNGIGVYCAVDPVVRNCRVDDFQSVGVRLETCWGGLVEGDHTVGADTEGRGYGVSLTEACRNVLVRGNHLEKGRHGVTGGGSVVSVFCKIQDNHAHHTSANAFDCHEETLGWEFDRNHAYGCTGGIGIRGQAAKVRWNVIRYTTTDGILVHSDDTNSSGIIAPEVIGNDIARCGGNGINWQGTAVCRLSGGRITGNKIAATSSNNIAVSCADDLDVEPNTYGPTEAANTCNLRIIGTAEEHCTDVQVSGGKYRGAFAFAFRADFVEGLTWRDVSVDEKVFWIKSCTKPRLLNVVLEEETAPTWEANVEAFIQGGLTNLAPPTVNSVTEAGEADFVGGPDEEYTLEGVTVKKIKARRRGRILRIRLNSSTSKLVDGENLKLAGNLEGSGKTLTLEQQDTATYIELGRAST